MNPVLILTHNCLELTKRCVESVQKQDIGTEVIILDNGSTDGTLDWLHGEFISQIGTLLTFDTNEGVSRGWNSGLKNIFSEWTLGYKHTLIINNDTEIPTWLYSELLSYDAPFVTGVAVDYKPSEKASRMPLVPHPDFSCFLIRRDAWEKVGPFDERMKLYASDTDWHIRAHRLGMPLMKANVPYYHINSQTMKRAAPEEKAAIQEQANKDREVFRSLYGCLPGTPDYEALFR